MVRRFDDHVEVRSGAGPARQPEAFIWKGRLYVVREVLGQWRERRAWWRDALDAEPEQAVGGQVAGSEQGPRIAPSEAARSEMPSETQSGGVSCALAAAAAEQEIWRVEASPGWSFAPGVYDLAHEPASDPVRADRWSLVRVAD